MPFVHMDGVDGLVYVPDPEPLANKKHPCPDCEACQHCSDARCNICLRDQCAKSGTRNTKCRAQSRK